MVPNTIRPDIQEIIGDVLPVGVMPFELLRDTLPGRHCDSDNLMNFAWQQSGQIPGSLARVPAICGSVHNNIGYRHVDGIPTGRKSSPFVRGHTLVDGQTPTLPLSCDGRDGTGKPRQFRKCNLQTSRRDPPPSAVILRRPRSFPVSPPDQAIGFINPPGGDQ